MTGKNLTILILSALLISTLFTAFLSAPISMPVMRMITMDSQMNRQASQNTGDNHFTMPCCDMISASCVSLALIIHQFDDIALSGENKRIINSNLAIHFTVIQNTTPPPKA